MSSCTCGSTTLPNGIDGNNAYTITTASYIQPNVDTPVTISVSSSSQYIGIWAATSQIIFIEDGGYYIVVSSTSNTITCKYDSSYQGFNTNLTINGGTVSSGKKVSPAGLIGNTGASGETGVQILDSYLSLTGIGNDAAIGDSTLYTYTIPESTLSIDGNYLDIDIYYDYNDNDKCIVKFKLGGSTIISFNQWNSDITKNKINIQISRINNTSQLWVFDKQEVNSTLGEHTAYIKQTSSSVTLSNNNTFDIVVDNTVLGANQVVLKKCVIKKIYS